MAREFPFYQAFSSSQSLKPITVSLVLEFSLTVTYFEYLNFKEDSPTPGINQWGPESALPPTNYLLHLYHWDSIMGYLNKTLMFLFSFFFFQSPVLNKF
jgi:hypothetical protein